MNIFNRDRLFLGAMSRLTTKQREWLDRRKAQVDAAEFSLSEGLPDILLEMRRRRLIDEVNPLRPHPKKTDAQFDVENYCDEQGITIHDYLIGR